MYPFLLLASAILPAFGAALPSQRVFSSHFGIPGQNATFDYVIVGGGTAGLTMALRLSEDGTKSVALIEAGGFYQTDSGNTSVVPAYAAYYDGMAASTASAYPLVDWGIVTTPQVGLDNVTYHYSRGKTLGGSTAENGLIYHRGTVDSYQLWADSVNDTSYTWDSFLPFFQKSTNYTAPNTALRAANASIPDPSASAYTASGGPLHISYSNWESPYSSWVQIAMRESGIEDAQDFQSGTLAGAQYNPGTLNPDDQTRDTAQTSFLNAALANPKFNLQVFTRSLAKQIVFDSDKTATGVVVTTAGINYTLSAKEEVISCAGAFQSPQLLMVSGIGPADKLAAYDIPLIANVSGVGQHMWDQIFFGLSYPVNLIENGALHDLTYAYEQQAAYQQNGTGIYTSIGSSYLGWEKLPAEFRANLSDEALSHLESLPGDWPDSEYLSLRDEVGALDNSTTSYGSLGVALLGATSRGTVDIASASMDDLPIVNPNWLATKVDQEVAIASFRRLQQVLDAPGLKPILLGPLAAGPVDDSDEAILTYIKGSISTIWHAACTCRMGVSAEEGSVVDSKANVFGVKGLKVVDASSFPILPPGHPMATVYALAEKIAADIVAGW